MGKETDSRGNGKAKLGPRESVTSAQTLPIFDGPTFSNQTSGKTAREKKSKGLRSRMVEFQRWISDATLGENRASLASTASSSATGSRTSPFSETYISSPAIDESVSLSPDLTGSPLSLPSNSNLEASVDNFNHFPAPSVASVDLEAEQAVGPITGDSSPPNSTSWNLNCQTIANDNDFSPTSSLLPSRNLAGGFSEESHKAISKMSSSDGMETKSYDRHVDEFIDAKSGSEDPNLAGTYLDAEGVRVRKIRLFSNQNVGFESLPVQFVNKATKAGFVFNVLVIGETGVGKSTLINSLFNYDFKLPPGDYQYESVALDKHTYQLEEGSVRLQLTIIETKGYGDQINMADSCQGIVEYIDKQYEAYFQEESQVVRRLSDYKDTRIHVCLFLLAPTGSAVRALDLECMKLLGNKVNIIPVVARGDSLTKKELENFKRRIVDELRAHKINIYKFPEDDAQVADLNRKMNADVPFAVVGSSDVHEVAGHKTRARIYPWGIVDIENENHCDFTRFREALLRVNMDHLMQTTHLRHYELYRDRRMEELGYDQKENHSFMDTISQLRVTNEQKYRQMEEETRASFVSKVRAKESELKERERELHAQFDQRRQESSEKMAEMESQRSALQKETEIFNRLKTELINHSSGGTIKTKKK